MGCDSLRGNWALYTESYVEGTYEPQTDTGFTMTDIEQTLDERGKRYGNFESQSMHASRLRNILIQPHRNMPCYMEEALIMISNKLGRILNGDPYYDDSWRDIAGYATLVVEILEKENEQT